jgi:YVTN family beta-propeller protein
MKRKTLPWLVLAVAVVVVASQARLGVRASETEGERASARQAALLQEDAQQRKAEAGLDFEVYRERIEPIFLKKREGGTRCYDCHSMLATRLRLERLAEGSSSWSEEQSRQNFEVVSRLVTPGEPMKSPLLLHPLATQAGGDATHTGGKFWVSTDDPEWRTLAGWVRSGSPGAVAAKTTASETKVDQGSYLFFKTSIEPIFLKARPGHARCYGCHDLPNRIFHLETLPPGRTEWTEDESKRNYKSAVRLVAPGDPYSSRLLLHPLAPEAGGDAFHSGGRQFATQADSDWITMAEWIRGLRPREGAPAEAKAWIYVTNSAGQTVDVVDPATNKVTQSIRGIELPHGVNFSPNGERVYVSNEAESVLDVVDRKSGEILQKIPLIGRPNNIAVTKDGGRVLVAIRSDPGVVDLVDTVSLARAKSIPVNGSAHNVFITPDGKYAVSGSIENKAATVIDLKSEQAVWEVKFDAGVRPMAFEKNADGSTARVFVQLSNFNGFAVVDFAKRGEVARIKLPDQPSGFGVAEGRTGTPSHGIGVAPDGKSLWVNSTFANAVFEYSLPELQLIGHVALPEVHPVGHAPTGSVPEWITFTPDNRTIYVSNSGAGSLSAIDVSARKIIAIIPVGEVPKRINTMVIPAGPPRGCATSNRARLQQ